MLSKEKRMGDQIRSTWEIVLEKLEKIGKADPEELKLENLKGISFQSLCQIFKRANLLLGRYSGEIFVPS
jgi:hypothetical protein